MQESRSRINERSRVNKAEVDQLRLAVLPILFSIGVCSVMISALARVNERMYSPEHLPVTPSVFFGLSGGIAGLIVGSLIIRWVRRNPNSERGRVFWIISFFTVALGLPLFTGALLPIGAFLMDVYNGHVVNILNDFLRALIVVPRTIIVQGSMGIFTGLLSSSVFCILIASYDKFFSNRLGSINTLLTAGSVSVLIMVLTRLAPADLLSKLG